MVILEFLRSKDDSSLRNLFLTFSDIDECVKEKDNCHVDANCTNTEGSFYCTCHTGYYGDGVMCDGTVM